MGDKEYNPYDHREPPEKGISKPTAYFYMTQLLLGTGFLAMPYAISRLGWLIGLGVLTFILILCVSAAHVVFFCEKRICIRHQLPQVKYGEAFRISLEDGPKYLKCFSPIAEPLVIVATVLLQFGIIGIFYIYVALALILMPLLGDSPLWPYFIIVLPAFMLVNLIQDMKQTIAALMVIIVTTVSAYIMFLYLLCNENFEEVLATKDNFPEMIISVGIFIYALHTIPIVTSIEEKMYTPTALHGWLGIINISSMIVVALYMIFGVLGYGLYGEDVEPLFTKNLKENNPVSKVSILVHGIAILFSYHLQSKYIIKLVWKNYFKLKFPEETKKEILLMYETIFRVFIPIVGIILVLLAPAVEMIMSFLGGFLIGNLGLVVPGIMALATASVEPSNINKFGFLYIAGSVFLIFGVISIFAGIYGPVHEGIKIFSYGNYTKVMFGV